MTTPLLFTLSQPSPLLAARGNMKRHAQEMLEKKVRKKKKGKTISITQEKESLVGVIWLIMLNGELGGGKIGPREQISQHSWGRTVRQGIKGSQHRLSPPRLCKLKLKFGILSYELQKCLLLLGLFFFPFNFFLFYFIFPGENFKCCLNFFFLVKSVIKYWSVLLVIISDSHHIFFTCAIRMD